MPTMNENDGQVAMHPTQSRNSPLFSNPLFNFSTATATATASTSTQPASNRSILSSSRASSSLNRSERRVPIKRITAGEYAVLYANHVNEALPESSLFPYLHGGADIPNTSAANYFGFAKGAAASVPNHIGLTLVCADDPYDEESTRTRSDSTSTFSSGSSSVSSAQSATSAAHEHRHNRCNPQPNSLLISSHPYLSIITPPPASLLNSSHKRRGAAFNLPSSHTFHRNVNLRHFALQKVKYATISNIVIYSREGCQEEGQGQGQGRVETVAKWVSEAMQRISEERGEMGHSYTIYLIVSPFIEFEKHHSELVAIDSSGYQRNRLNFLEREKEEMRVLTQCSEIGENIWLGNNQDLPLPLTCTPRSSQMPTSSTSTSLSSLAESEANPFGFAVCIEAFDGASVPTLRELRAVEERLDRLERTDGLEEVSVGVGWEQYQEGRAVDEGEAGVKKILRPKTNDIIHLECASNVDNSLSTIAQRRAINELVTLATYLHSITTTTSASTLDPHDQPRTPLRVLIHSHDGYTETSLLALTYIMYSRSLCLPEAYLFLQLIADRSFFVGAKEVAILEGVEKRVREVLHSEREERDLVREEEKVERARVTRDATGESYRMARSDSGFESNSSKMSRQSHLNEETIIEEESENDESYSQPVGSDSEQGGPHKQGMTRSDMGLPVFTIAPSASVSTSASTGIDQLDALEIEDDVDPVPVMTTSNPVDHAWFYADTWEGSFPSRILPFLYLGNLAHATNPLMLKDLGVTHIVSMGESALLPPRPQSKSFKKTIPTNSLWLEERMGNIKVLDLPNIADDGIDSLGPFIKPALDFMALARLSGGKILVHCRVGVSRSASIVISYLMRELELDLASAYLLCRSRRLNILIQPNLPFMMSLHGLEIELIREREARLGVAEVEDEGEVGEAGLKRSNRVTWSYFCTELAKLNERFLC